MAQFARPDSNVTQTSFTNGFSNIDEASASDADFAYGANNTAAELEVGLSNVSDPVVSSGHTFRYRIARTDDGVVDGGGNAVTVTARLMQGTTQIATDTAKTATGTWTQYAYTLSASEANAITDYTDLRLEFVTSASGGSPANRRGAGVSWAELEVPVAPQTVSLSGGITPGGGLVRQARKALLGLFDGPSGGALSHTEYYNGANLGGQVNPTIAVTGVSWAPGDLIVVYVTGREAGGPVAVTSVTDNGPGETFSAVEPLLITQQGVLFNFVYAATASGTGSSATITASIEEDNVVADGGYQIEVFVIPDAAIDASNVAETGATDSSTPSVDLTTVEATTRVFYIFNCRGALFNEDTNDGLTAIREGAQAGAGGSISSVHSYYKDETTAGSKNGSGTLSSATDWMATAFSVKSTGGGTPGAISGALDAILGGPLTVMLSGAIGATGGLARETQKALAGTVTSAASAVRETAKALAGTVSSSSSLTPIKLVLRSFAGTIGLSSGGGGSVSDIEVVQSKLATGTNPTATFDQTATDGNLLVVFAGRRDNGTDIPTPSGWSLTPEGTFTNESGQRGGALFYKVSDGTETSVQLSGISVVFGFAEFSGVDTSAIVDSAEFPETTTSAYEAGDVIGDGQDRVLVVGGVLSAFFGNGASVTPDAGTTELFESAAPGGEKPNLWMAYSVVDSPSGALTVSGTGPNCPTAGSVLLFAASSGSGGGLIKQVNKALAGSASSAGSFARMAGKGLAGAVTMASSLIKHSPRSFAGAVTPSATLAAIKTVLLSFAGAIAPAGALTKSTTATLAGAVSSAGALARETALSFAGTVTSSATVVTIKAFLRAFAGSLGPTGALSRSVDLSFGGTVAAAGSLIKRTATSFAGSVTSAATLTAFRVGQSFQRSFAGAIGPAGSFQKEVRSTFSGTVALGGTLVRRFARTMTGTIGPTGTLTRRFARTMSATIGPAGSLVRRFSTDLAGSLGPTGTLAKTIAKRFAGAVASAASLVALAPGTFVVHIGGTIASAGSLATSKLRQVLLVASRLRGDTVARARSALTRSQGSTSSRDRGSTDTRS